MPAVSSLKCAMAHSVPVVKGLSDIVHACVFLLSVSIRRVVAIATLFTVTTNSCDPVCVFAVTCLACGADTQNVETCPVLSLTVPNVSVVYILPISLLTSICTVLSELVACHCADILLTIGYNVLRAPQCIAPLACLQIWVPCACVDLFSSVTSATAGFTNAVLGGSGSHLWKFAVRHARDNFSSLFHILVR